MSNNKLNRCWKSLILSFLLIQVARITAGGSISNKDSVKLVSRALRPYRANFTFVVPDFRALHKSRGYKTSNFSTESEPGVKLDIRLHFNGFSFFMILYVVSLPAAFDRISSFGECALIDLNGEKRIFLSQIGSATDNQKFLRKALMKNAEIFANVKELLPDGQLTMQCEIKGVLHSNAKPLSQLITEQIREPVNASSDCAKDIAPDTLNKLRLFQDDIPRDIEFKSSDKRFKCHSIIVHARMPLFKLTSSTVADPQNVPVYDLTDEVNPEELEDMVRFMYSGKAPTLDKTCRVLYGVASKYGFECLKFTCEEVLIGQVKATNAKDYFKIAQEIGSVRLEKMAAICNYELDDETC